MLWIYLMNLKNFQVYNAIFWHLIPKQMQNYILTLSLEFQTAIIALKFLVKWGSTVFKIFKTLVYRVGGFLLGSMTQSKRWTLGMQHQMFQYVLMIGTLMNLIMGTNRNIVWNSRRKVKSGSGMTLIVRMQETLFVNKVSVKLRSQALRSFTFSACPQIADAQWSF